MGTVLFTVTDYTCHLCKSIRIRDSIDLYLSLLHDLRLFNWLNIMLIYFRYGFNIKGFNKKKEMRTYNNSLVTGNQIYNTDGYDRKGM